MLDTHCHLTSKEFTGRGRVGQVLADAAAAGVHGAVTVATTSSDCLAARALARTHPNVWFSAGIHPLHSDEPINWDDVLAVATDPRCVAWGELGLDNHYDRPPRALQNTVLADQLAFIQGQEGIRHQASGTGDHKPIIVHCRDAFDELLSIFAQTSFDPSRFVFHCFTGTVAEARKVLDFGAWISFTGIVTFHNAREVAEAAKLVPADRIMVETDSPFLSPEPVRKVRPNEPKHVVHIARRLANLRGVDPTAFAHQLDTNAQRFFKITPAPAKPQPH